jgi:hypothetical protein
MRTLLLLFPATAIAVAGYLVLYFANKSEGGMRSFGKALGGWAMFLSAVVVAAAISGVFMDGRPFGIGKSRAERMEMRGGVMGPGGMRGRMGPPPGMAAPPAPPGEASPPAPPATPPSNN